MEMHQNRIKGETNLSTINQTRKSISRTVATLWRRRLGM